MTEEEWLGCADPTPMLEFLRGKVSERKLRRFVIGCCRRVWTFFANDRCERAIEIAERCADGSLSLTDSYALGQELELYCDYDLAMQFAEEKRLSEEACRTALLAIGLIHGFLDPNLANTVAKHASNAVVLQTGNLREYDYEETEEFERDAIPFRIPESTAQAALLRDIFSNPFRPITINPTWLTATVTSLATLAYEERALPSGELDTARLAVLADALEDAGCDNQNILGHLRSPGPHVRGCWPVDMLTGRG